MGISDYRNSFGQRQTAQQDSGEDYRLERLGRRNVLADLTEIWFENWQKVTP
jgi:hypothetical protein